MKVYVVYRWAKVGDPAWDVVMGRYSTLREAINALEVFKSRLTKSELKKCYFEVVEEYQEDV